MPSNHLILCCPLLLLPSIFPSIRVFSNESVLRIRWPKYWTSASVLPMNIQGWFPLGLTHLISLLSKALKTSTAPQFESIIFFDIQPSLWSNSHSYMTTGKTIALTTWNFVNKVMSLLFNTLSRFVIAFLPRIKHLLISWLQSLSYSDVGAQENKIYQCFHFSPIYLLWSDGTKCHDLSFLNVEF